MKQNHHKDRCANRNKAKNGTKKFATTVNYYNEYADFVEQGHILNVPESLEHPKQKAGLLNELLLLWRILVAACRFDTLLLFCHRGHIIPELLATVILGLLPQRFRPSIVFYGEMYEPNSGLRAPVEQLIMHLADRAIVRYVVYSQAEIVTFAKAWGVAESKIRFSRHPYYGEKKKQPPAFICPADAPHIFASGNSFRDFSPLLDAARQLPDMRIVICTSVLSSTDDVPPNVRIASVPHNEYIELMRMASAVVVPIATNTYRIAGALTYLESMWLMKPTIVSDALAVREYVENGQTGWVVDGSSEGYVAALRTIHAPENWPMVQEVCKEGRKSVDVNFNLATHVEKLLEIMDEVIREQIGAKEGGSNARGMDRLNPSRR